jgi:tetraacyldisaccharide 4'-kinase
LLPAGPLREPEARLSDVDAVVINGKLEKPLNIEGIASVEMQLESGNFYNLMDSAMKCGPQAFANQQVLAIAGIGNPERFFQQLQHMGLFFQSKAYPDHHAFQQQHFESVTADIVLMTEKDAVKCQAFAQPSFWVLPVNAAIKSDLMAIILNKLRQ